jgi:putative acetyltransferase
MNKKDLVTIDIQNYSEQWVKEITNLFYQSVHAIDSSVYTVEQKAAWAPTLIDYAFWLSRLEAKKTFVAIVNNHVAGFIELDADGHIDCTYTHPDFQGMGVASMLCEHLQAEAIKRNIQRLYVKASIIAKPFFEHRGFAVFRENVVQRHGELLVNFSMEKSL